MPDSPMRAAASAKLKKSKWGDLLGWGGTLTKAFKPIGYKPPAQQAGGHGGKTTPWGRMKKQEEEQEAGTFTARKPEPEPKSDYVPWPTTKGQAQPKFKSVSPRELARRRREARSNKAIGG